jgi:hypothetical protein
MTDPDLVDRHLGLALSDAEVERDQAIAWLLAHPDEVRPALVERIGRGQSEAPEIHLRLLAAIGGEGAVAAATAALVRGHPGESFWAAQALAALGPPGHVALADHADDPRPEVRHAVSTARSTMQGDDQATQPRNADPSRHHDAAEMGD